MDVILSLLPNTAAITVPAAPATAPTLTSTQVPPGLAALPPGTLISGFVLNRDASGNPVLRTEGGDYLIQSNFFLKIGSDVVVRVDAAGAHFKTSILSVDGHSPAEAESIPAHDKDADVITRSDRVSAQPAARQSAVLTGTLVSPAPGTALSRGTQVQLQLLNVALPGIAAAPAEDTPEVDPAHSQQYGAYARYAERSVPAQGAAPAPAAAQALAGSAFPAEVVSGADTAEALLQTPLGTVRLGDAGSFPPGSKLTVQLVQLLGGAAASETFPATIASLANGWQSLQDIVDALTALDLDAATAFLRAALPTSSTGMLPSWQNLAPTAQNMSAGMFLFMNALTGGSFRGWLGDKAVKALEAHGQAGLIAKAEGEFEVMRTLFTQAPADQWQALFMPLLLEGELKPVRLYVKREKKPKTDARPAQNDTRFIIELELSQTGPMQLDGFVRKRELAGTQFDLVIRTYVALPPEAERDIQGIFSGLGDATGYKGMVLFQEVNAFQVKPLEEIMSRQHREVVA